MDQHLYMGYLLYSSLLLFGADIIAHSNIFRGCSHFALFFILLFFLPFQKRACLYVGQFWNGIEYFDDIVLWVCVFIDFYIVFHWKYKKHGRLLYHVRLAHWLYDFVHRGRVFHRIRVFFEPDAVYYHYGCRSRDFAYCHLQPK